MSFFVLPLFLACCSPGTDLHKQQGGSYLYQPAYDLGPDLHVPAAPYCAQPGDIFLATDQSMFFRVGHWAAGGSGVHHSGILFSRTDGSMALLEAGPFNSIRVQAMDPLEHIRKHDQLGDKVWIRRRRCPLTAEQSCLLTSFVEAQVGKPFATMRLAGQVTPLRSRGPLRTWFVGKPHGERRTYFCSELVMESCVAAGLLDPATTRPSATYPRDLFFGTSINCYLAHHLSLEPGWFPPARWTGCAGPAAVVDNK